MKRKEIIAASLICVSGLVINGLVVSAAESYNYNSNGDAVPSQAGYRAVRSVNGNELGCGELSEPSDIFCDNDGNFYIADTGNDRIIVVDPDFKTALDEFYEFTDEDGSKLTLSSPEGIFVSDKGYMYIADTDNSRILVSDKNSNIKMKITKPESAIYENKTFKPQKVIVDKSGNIYSVINNVTSGAAFFSSDGEFEGYYGANSVEPTAEVIANYFRKRFATDEIRASSSRSTPAGITGFDIDSEGFVYTVTESTSYESDRIKKINPAGMNLFSDLDLTFGDLPSYQNCKSDGTFSTRLIDIDVDDIGRICCLDMSTGRIFQYDEEGSLLFIMGGRSERLGGFSLQPTALEVSGKNIYVTDALKNTVTIFEETDFGKIVHKAAELYNEGRYEDALEPWHEVLRYDGNYSSAYLGLSAALLCKGDYRGAMKYAELGGSSYHYNKAFEGYRLEWLSENFSIVMSAVVIFVLLCTAYGHYRKKIRQNAPKNLVEMLCEEED